MTDVGRIEATVWFWTFTVLVLEIMLNMLLAVVMDVYQEVKSSIPEDAETMVSQSVEIWMRYRGVWTGELVKISDIMWSLQSETSDAQNDMQLRPKDLMKLVEKMSEVQAAELLMSAQRMEDYLHPPEEPTVSDAMQRLDAIEAAVGFMIRAPSADPGAKDAAPVQNGLKTPKATEQRSAGQPGDPPNGLPPCGSTCNLASVLSAIQGLSTQVATLQEEARSSEREFQRFAAKIETELALQHEELRAQHERMSRWEDRACQSSMSQENGTAFDAPIVARIRRPVGI
eukprot:gnl/TRDRNA2_/TRDRNA2_124128_c1_seq1.p1 gnl/TRDRNA2_/TRDRNA2_124128_c1~~gnl/TRDRNA2_/TRDRNA2_124128_c1_seq1.p1  ORF type:complete len:326 (-),score=63.58 gnl/TRDRNA2_/TRDRNA2_124128_c1_seq1:95-952(-)